MKQPLNPEEFKQKIQGIKTVKSVRGVVYSQIKICGNEIIGKRESTKEEFCIDLQQLYLAYTNLEHITTTTLKEYVDRVQSPALAILKEIGI